MEIIKEVFSDGAETIHILNNTVRFDLFSLQPPEDGDKPTQEPFERIIMPMQAFLNMFGTMQQLMDKLKADGIVTDKPKQ